MVGSVFSETLRSITDQKFAELSKQKSAFQTQLSQVYEAAQSSPDPLAEVRILLDGVKKCFAIKTDGDISYVPGGDKNQQLKDTIANMERFLGQAQYDPCVSSKLVNDWKGLLTQRLEAQSAKYDFASLYARLVNEWLLAEKGGSSPTTELGGSGSFEQIASKAKLESRREWEDTVFAPLETDQRAITSYLSNLFGKHGSNKQAVKALDKLREEVAQHESWFAGPEPFTEHALRWTIKSLIASDFLTNEKREVLKDFTGNPTILTEIADVLNMRMTAIDTWTWGTELELEQRKRINGTYQIYMHEDLLQAIFLHFIGIKWSVFIKHVFRQFVKHDGVWLSTRTEIPALDKKRRAYFLGPLLVRESVQSKRRSIYLSKYFMTQLLDREDQEVETAEGEEEAEFKEEAVHGRTRPRTMQTARKQMVGGSLFGSAPNRRVATREDLVEASDEEDEEEEEAEDAAGDKPKNLMNNKQELLHLLATEILLNTRLHGEITCVHAEFDRWYSMLPHSTVTTVLRFLGISERWLGFFAKFMQAPLAFPGEQPRTRRKGVPASHSLSEFLGESILFCLDFAVNQHTQGQQLYRIHDDFWFWSSNHNTCVTAWKTITDFASVMGVRLNKSKAGTVRTTGSKAGSSKAIDRSLPTGQIRWGFLYLDSDSGRFSIDQSMVDQHVAELQKQLSGQETIFSWIQTWNSYANTFFTTNFGKPADCYGQAHIDMILATLQRIQRNISNVDGHSSVVESLKARLAEQFDIHDIPDGYIFFPTVLGGLELTNPFVGILQIRNAVSRDPAQLLDDSEEAEREEYRKAKSRFDKGQRPRKSSKYLRDDPRWQPEDPDTFMPFEEFTRYREEFAGDYSKDLSWAFEALMKRPDPRSIAVDPDVLAAFSEVAGGGAMGPAPVSASRHAMNQYWYWVGQLYAREMRDKFGGLCVVDPGLLPIGLVSLVRSGRVKWKD